MISKRGWYNDLGINANAGNLMVNRFRQGNLSVDKMDEVLEKAGYRVLREKDWGAPGTKPSIDALYDSIIGDPVIIANGVIKNYSSDGTEKIEWKAK